MASYTIHFMICPRCRNRIKRGVPHFGPAEVKCKHCQEVVPTGLPAWRALSQGQKTWFSILEILNPSWFGLQGFDSILAFIMQMFFWGIFMFPFAILGSLFTFVPGLMAFFLVLAFLTYPAVLVVRLVRMIRESESYNNQQQIPVWKF